MKSASPKINTMLKKRLFNHRMTVDVRNYVRRQRFNKSSKPFLHPNTENSLYREGIKGGRNSKNNDTPPQMSNRSFRRIHRINAVEEQ